MRSIRDRAPWLAGFVLLASGCAAGNAVHSASAVDAPPSTIVAEVRHRCAAELNGTRDQLRILDGEVTVEFVLGKGAPLDAGSVTLDGKAMVKDSDRSGVVYRLGRESLDRLPPPGSDGWVELWVGGSAAVPRSTMKVQLAPLPLVMEPTPNQTVIRSQPLFVKTEGGAIGPPLRITLMGSAESISPGERGPGQWEFPADALRPMTPGEARLMIESDASCGLCPGAADVAMRWSSRMQLEIRLAVY